MTFSEATTTVPEKVVGLWVDEYGLGGWGQQMPSGQRRQRVWRLEETTSTACSRESRRSRKAGAGGVAAGLRRPAGTQSSQLRPSPPLSWSRGTLGDSPGGQVPSVLPSSEEDAGRHTHLGVRQNPGKHVEDEACWDPEGR